MARLADYSNTKLGEFTIIQPLYKNQTTKPFGWEAKCINGHITILQDRQVIQQLPQPCWECRVVKNLKINKWKIIEYAGRIDNQNRVRCECECGNIKNIRYHDLMDGVSKSCGECYDKYGDCHEYYLRLKGLAATRNIDFQITLEEIYDLYLKQNQLCALTTWPIAFVSAHFRKKNKIQQTASLDRIDNNKPYQINNLQWVHKDVNWIKQDFELNYFLFLCKCVYNYKIHNKLIRPSITITSPNYSGKKYYELPLYYINRVKNRAIKRTQKFDVSIEYLWELYKKQNKRCNLSSLPIYFGNEDQITASLDRINPSEGYVVNNLQWTHKDVNFLRLDFNIDYLIKLCEAITINKE